MPDSACIRKASAIPLLLLIASLARPIGVSASAEVAMSGQRLPSRAGITETVGEIMERDRRLGLADRKSPPVAAPAPGLAGPKQASPAALPQRTARESSAAVPVLGTSFKAVEFIADSNSVPPDTMGSVGPTQILVHTNGRVRLFDRSGVVGALNTTADNFWASVGGVTNGTSDPHVEYDRLSERWFLTIITVENSPNDVLVAVSSGPTITDGTSFTFFGFQGEAGRFTDYPTLGVDKHAVYIGANMFDATTFAFRNTTVFVIDKADLLAPTPTLTVTAFRNLINTMTGDGPFTPQAATNWDPNATHGYLVGVDAAVFSELNVMRINDPAGTPTLTRVDIVVPTTTFPLDVPQPSPGPLLDALDDRIYEVIVQRLPGGEPRLWLAHNIEVDASGTGSATGGRTGSRWYELGNLSVTPTVIQSGTIFDPAASQPFSYWIPSIAANGQGHAVIGMSRAGANPSGGHASAAVAERLPGDPLGAMGAPTVLQSSMFLYDTVVVGKERWGDYSQTVIDPNDNMTFWTFQEYTSAPNRWGVRVMEIRAKPPATPVSATPRTLAAAPSVMVDITGTSVDGSGFFDPVADIGAPDFPNHLEASVDGGVLVNDVTFTDPTHITLDLDTSSADGTIKTLAVTNPDGQSIEACGLFGVGNEGDTAAPSAFGLVAPDDGATVSATPTFTWQASSDAGCGLDKYQLWIDGVLNRDNISSSETSTTPVAPLSPGPHTWMIVAVDGASPPNSTDSETRSFTVEAPVLAACAGQPATHVGTSGNDTILGTSGNDVIVALGGSDIVKSKGGNDVVCAGPGKDTVRAGSANDLVLGQGGRDFLLGQGGKDRIKGGGGRDRIKGGSGRDNLRGQGAKDTVRGQGGADRLNGGPGRDLCNGGAGRDRATACEEEQLIP